MTDTVFPTGDTHLTPSASMALFADDGTRGGYVTASDVLGTATVYAETVYTASGAIAFSTLPLVTTTAILSSASPLAMTVGPGTFDGQNLHIKRASGSGGAHTVAISTDNASTTFTLNSANGGEDIAFRWSAGGATWRQTGFYDPGVPLYGSAMISYGSSTVVNETIRIDLPQAALLQNLKTNVGGAGGSFTVTIQNNGVAIAGLTSVAVNSTSDTVIVPTSSTTITAGSTLNVVISGVSSSPVPTGAFLLLTWRY